MRRKCAGSLARRSLVCAFVVLVTLAPSFVTGRTPEAPARITVSGRLALIWGDPRPGSGGAHDTSVVISTADGRSFTIDLDETSGAVLASVYRFSGQAVTGSGELNREGKLALSALSADVGPRPDASSSGNHRPVIGHQQWASVLCRFSDSPDYTPVEPAYVDALMNGPYPGVGNYWREVSDQQVDVDGSTVWGWYTLPQPRSTYISDTPSGPQINYDALSNDCAGMIDDQVNFNDLAGLNLMFNGELDGYSRGGTYYYEFDGLDRSIGTTWIPPWGYQMQYITAHEMGHAFGLPHSSGPYDQTYDSFWDVMSGGGTCNPYDQTFGCVGPHTIAFHKDWLGWIPSDRRFVFSAPQDATITLEQSALPNDNGGCLIAKVPIQATAGRYYTVEVRRFVGYDRYVPGQAVVIHQVDESRFDRVAQVVDPDGNGNPNDDGAMWLPGETFRDALNDVTISVDSATDSGFVVSIHAGDAFTRTWSRTDRPVADSAVSRTWMWGPDSFSGTVQEEYREASGSVRNVRYYDKSRMEINDPNGDPASIWYVTNGLLVVELTTGRVQLGDDVFEQRQPATIDVAGDADDPTGPTYATFGGLRAAPPRADDAAIVQRLDRAGNVIDDPALAGQGVTAAYRVQVPGIDHQVASAFWDFMNSSGTVWDDGYVDAPLFQDPFYATGYPISEAYWARVKVAGQYVDVLMQCFERRCLTYAPDNPEGWKVEAGNVGRHYYDWRYAPVDFDGALAFASDLDGDSDIFVLHSGESQPTAVVSDPAYDFQPELSLDGSRIAFVRPDSHDMSNVWVADVDGSNARQVTTGMQAFEPSWSPDGSRIVFQGSVDNQFQIWVVDADGANLTRLSTYDGDEMTPDWSPDGSKIAFARSDAGGTNLYVMDADGSHVEQLTFASGGIGAPDWSPDGTEIVYVEAGFIGNIAVIAGSGGTPRIVAPEAGFDADPVWSPDGSQIAYVYSPYGFPDVWIVDADGSDPHNVTRSPAYETHPSWAVDSH